MADAVREFVANLTPGERTQIIRDYEKLEKYGQIGDCELRNQATILMHSLGANTIIMWMEFLVKEVYRYYAYKFLEQEDIKN